MGEDLKRWWTSAQWRAASHPWITQALESAGLAQTGPIEQRRLRFWSTQLTVETTMGRFWFKENNPDQAFEAGLVGTLASIVPDHVVAPLAVEVDRGWMLSPDQGRTMYAAGNTKRSAWEQVVREFGLLQRQLAGHADILRACGLPSLGPAAAPMFTRDVLARAAARPAADPRRVEAGLARQVEDALEWLTESARLLESGPIPLSLEHNDLHANNTFDPDGSGSLRFFDFGDSVWAHPFVSMAVPVEHMSGDWEVEPDADEVQYVLDAYLEVWSDLTPTAELRDMLRVALPFGQLHRLKSWDTVLEFAGEDDLSDFGGAIPGWLHRLVAEVERAR